MNIIMKRIYSWMGLLIVLLFSTISAVAQTKVVVVPLLGDEAPASVPSASGQHIAGSSSFNGFGDGTDNFIPVGASGRTTSFDTSKLRMGVAGTVTKFFGGIDNTIASSTSYTLTFIKNSVAQSLACTISGPTNTTCTDLSHCVQLSVGDEVAVRYTGAGGPVNRAARWSGVFTPGASCP